MGFEDTLTILESSGMTLFTHLLMHPFLASHYQRTEGGRLCVLLGDELDRGRIALCEHSEGTDSMHTWPHGP